MPYDEALAERVREFLADNPEIVEKKRFGGIAFMLSGNMAVGVSRDELMVRVGEDGHTEALSQDGVRVFDLSGREMKGWILVGSEAIAENADLTEWIEAGLDFASSLPPK